VLGIGCNKIFSGTQPRQLVVGRNRRFGNYLCTHHQDDDGDRDSSETSVYTCNQLTRLCAREDFIEFSHRKSFKFYRNWMAYIWFAEGLGQRDWSIGALDEEGKWR
jgi:hypothetical protein